MIRIVNITQHYGIKPVLRDVSLEIPAGQRTVIVGPNGTGKTTLLAVMGGVLSPQVGYVEIDGIRRRGSVDGERELRRRVVYLPDRSFLPRHLTGREFLLEVGRLYDIPEHRLIAHAGRLLRLFELHKLADTPIRSYSAGQQKKAALCSALITDAEVLLFDEPLSGGLDPAGILAFRLLVERLTQNLGRTIVLTTPVPELVEEIADRVIIIKDGGIAVHGTLEEVVRSTGLTGRFDEVLNQTIFAETLAHIDQYFSEFAR